MPSIRLISSTMPSSPSKEGEKKECWKWENNDNNFLLLRFPPPPLLGKGCQLWSPLPKFNHTLLARVGQRWAGGNRRCKNTPVSQTSLIAKVPNLWIYAQKTSHHSPIYDQTANNTTNSRLQPLSPPPRTKHATDCPKTWQEKAYIALGESAQRSRIFITGKRRHEKYIRPAVRPALSAFFCWNNGERMKRLWLICAPYPPPHNPFTTPPMGGSSNPSFCVRCLFLPLETHVCIFFSWTCTKMFLPLGR